MRTELNDLAASLLRSGPAPDTESGFAETVGEAVVVLPAGGFGFRMRGATEQAGVVTQKSLLPLPNEETLIGRVVRQYAEAGFRRFVALVNYEGREVEAHLAEGAPWGVEVRCS